MPKSKDTAQTSKKQKKDSTTEFSEAISDAIGWFGNSTFGDDSSSSDKSDQSFGGSWAK